MIARLMSELMEPKEIVVRLARI